MGLPVWAAVVFSGPVRRPGSRDLAAYGVTRSVRGPAVDGYAPQAWASAASPRASWIVTARSWVETAIPAVLTHDHGLLAVAAGETERGNEVMAHLGAITGLPMAANCVGGVRRGEGARLGLVRQRWAGPLFEEAVSTRRWRC